MGGELVGWQRGGRTLLGHPARRCIGPCNLAGIQSLHRTMKNLQVGPGVFTGLVVGIVFAVFAFAIFLMNDSSSLDASGATMALMALSYVAGGVVGGFLFDTVGRATRTWPMGGALTGLLVSLPATLAITFTQLLEAEIVDRLVVAVLTSAVLGAPIGAMFLRKVK
jgi:MFS family permease